MFILQFDIYNAQCPLFFLSLSTVGSWAAAPGRSGPLGCQWAFEWAGKDTCLAEQRGGDRIGSGWKDYDSYHLLS